MNRRHKACRAPRLQPAMRHPPPLSASADLPVTVLVLALGHPRYRRASSSESSASSPGSPPGPLPLPSPEPFRGSPPASSETLLPTPPRDLWPLEFSSRAPLLRNLNSLRPRASPRPLVNLHGRTSIGNSRQVPSR